MSKNLRIFGRALPCLRPVGTTLTDAKKSAWCPLLVAAACASMQHNWTLRLR
jgi:hypothetical protein